ncbi:MAG: hypothetical protein PUF07_00790 [Bacteroidales bacterium]|nr:hypothetical protein [Bacteroidales bacterium]
MEETSHGVGTIFHGWGSFSHGIDGLRVGTAKPFAPLTPCLLAGIPILLCTFAPLNQWLYEYEMDFS